ncbi:BC1872 family protein [Thermoactinomyces mirandus]|uniref:Phage ABA sandwich domain-containing protein n=1 Tax=Thermoactinomyces mirandus TaxID=2756294 RepID=A0A7W1XT82_9BACL|nr:hypothetical protein [Thermoactinomyces mirandus]MBA4602650.1 hypothetical protein [Thermoactinomyces mirandus]
MHPKQREAQLRRQLDERIADEVMGLIVVKEGCPEMVFPGMVLTTNIWKKFFLKNPEMGPSLLEEHLLKSYSVLPHYAWKVVKRMQNLGFDYEIKSAGKQVSVKFQKEERSGTGVSESMAKSVCLAALDAIKGYWE